MDYTSTDPFRDAQFKALLSPDLLRIHDPSTTTTFSGTTSFNQGTGSAGYSQRRERLNQVQQLEDGLARNRDQATAIRQKLEKELEDFKRLNNVQDDQIKKLLTDEGLKAKLLETLTSRLSTMQVDNEQMKKNLEQIKTENPSGSLNELISVQMELKKGLLDKQQLQSQRIKKGLEAIRQELDNQIGDINDFNQKKSSLLDDKCKKLLDIKQILEKNIDMTEEDIEAVRGKLKQRLSQKLSQIEQEENRKFGNNSKTLQSKIRIAQNFFEMAEQDNEKLNALAKKLRAEAKERENRMDDEVQRLKAQSAGYRSEILNLQNVRENLIKELRAKENEISLTTHELSKVLTGVFNAQDEFSMNENYADSDNFDQIQQLEKAKEKAELQLMEVVNQCRILKSEGERLKLDQNQLASGLQRKILQVVGDKGDIHTA